MTDKEKLNEIKHICEGINQLDNSIIGIPDDSHCELAELILNLINEDEERIDTSNMD